MPGTTYYREGPTRDGAGRLADLARFVSRELDEILTRSELGIVPAGTIGAAQAMQLEAEDLKGRLAGYTTADD